ncbi:receptor-type tyrosine-protein phosphatase-like N isoform X2 [Pungitius pungitius]|uniref:receptor-type tyrosine-protein phosphatase-like N isoform X2 n=1 Tax=Pungitius pungitius TaxID=134920 RepID=UPI002E149529
MRSPRLCAALCLLLTVFCRLCAAARHGCLFEKKLCPRGQLCTDDGLFGRCRTPRQEPGPYQVPVPVLLRALMVRGLTWKDVPAADLQEEPLQRQAPRPRLSEELKVVFPRMSGPSQRRPRGPEGPADPGVAQQYADYMMLDPSRSSVRMQKPPLGPPTFPQYGFQEEEERSLNSLDEDPGPSRSGSQGNPLDRDRQLLQDLVSFYLTSPSSSSSSSPVQSLSRHRGGVAPAARPPSSLSSSFFPELDFPLDYGEDYVSQEARLSKPQESKEQEAGGAPSGLDERSLQRLSLLLHHYGLGLEDLEDLKDPQDLKDLKDLRDQSPQHSVDPLASLKQLESSYAPKQATDKYAATRKKVTEGSMAFKMAALEAPPSNTVTNQSTVGPSITFRTGPGSKSLTAGAEKNMEPETETGLTVQQSDVGERHDGKSLPLATRMEPRRSSWVFAALVAMACMGSVLVGAMTIACLRRHAHRLAAKTLGLAPEGGGFTHQEYQRAASKGAFGRLEAAALGAVGGAGGGAGGVKGGGAGVAGGAAAGGGGDSRVSSVSSQFSDGAQPSPSSHSSTPSWCEEPAQANMDISTGHMILAYMEDHLRNKDRLMKEWEALCSYQAEPSAVSLAQSDANAKKNRCSASVPYDHARVKLRPEVNPSRSDYVNASTIIEHDPRMPAYIATQGPLSHTISDFWQMVWENGCTVIVMLTALVEDGEKQCDRYWPDEGSSLYHIYEVNLVSEHIWCNDFLVRSFYLKNVMTQETRTLTQFHFLSWPAQGIPPSTRPLLDFRRKVNKCYRGRSCPIIVHCSNGTGRTGTYILIDMVLNRMAKGVKEIDIAATLEHVRDQRPGMVRTKDQFEFALTAVAEEVNAILKALPQ